MKRSAAIFFAALCLSAPANTVVRAPDAEKPKGIVADAPPFSLTFDQLFEWQPNGKSADARNISRVPLAPRFTDPDSKFDPRARIMFAPDGMNNFGNYLEPQPVFNLYTFSHWSQIDILNWFGGTADRGVTIPARPWVDAAHRNGVKVIGTVFFAPVAWGGSPRTVEAFLRQDADGSFPAAHRLVEVSQHYGFDGWLVNQETGLDEQMVDGRSVRNPAQAAYAKRLGEKMRAFMAYFKHIAPDSMEIHWYDSMLPDGSVDWQNSFNARNASMLQYGEQKTADGMFLNYQWTPETLRAGAALAERLGRSRYELFVGADLWPLRDNAQMAFRNAHWLDDMTDPKTGNLLGSVALFAPNFNYNFGGDAKTSRFSKFNEDSADVQNFYVGENRLFAGDDLNMATLDRKGVWPGVGSKIAARSTISALPFRTNFNMGHGQAQFSAGLKRGGPWSDMSKQDVALTWQAHYLPEHSIDIRYDFANAYEGGSSLLIASKQGQGASIARLFLTNIDVSSGITLSAVKRLVGSGRFALRIEYADGAFTDFKIADGRNWRRQNWCISSDPQRMIRKISVAVDPTNGSRRGRTTLNLGQLSLTKGCHSKSAPVE